MRVLMANIYNFLWLLIQIAIPILTFFTMLDNFGLFWTVIASGIVGFLSRFIFAIIRTPIDLLLCWIFKAPIGSFSSIIGLTAAYSQTKDPVFLEYLDARLGKDLNKKDAA